MNDFSIKKYDEKVGLFQQVRSGGPALTRAADRQRKFVVWDAGTLEGSITETEGSVAGNKDVAAMANYFHTNYVGAMEYMSQDEFRIGYHVYGDIERAPVLGENTASINYDLNWEKLPVDVDVYSGITYQVHPKQKLQEIERGGLVYRDEVAKFTGWNRQRVQQLDDSAVRDLTVMLKTAVVGQNKFTRLVKGFLLMLEAMHAPDQKIRIAREVQHTVLYEPVGIIGSFTRPSRAYLWCSDPASEVYVAVLLTMGEAWPPAAVPNSNVTVPPDAEEVYIVANGQNTPPTIDCNVNPTLIYAAILRYSEEVGIMDHVQGAMTCAASLFQNRYFSRIGLPKVVSFSDLIIPGLEQPSGSGAPKPFITAQQGRVLGRVHQMLAFMVSKDLISAAAMSTKDGFDPYDQISSYLSTQEQLVAQMGYLYSDIRLLEVTPQMKYLTRLSKDDCEDIASLPIFEALWLCDSAKKGVQNGILQMVKTGVKDNSDDTSTRDILIDEMRKAGMTEDLSLLPTGRFTTEGCAVESMRHHSLRPVRREWKPIERVFNCAHKPTAYTPKRKARIGNSTIKLPARTQVPLKPVLSPPRNLRKVVILEESPPGYASESKSSEYEPSPPPTEEERREAVRSEGLRPFKLDGARLQEVVMSPTPFLTALASEATGKAVLGDAAERGLVSIEDRLTERLAISTPGSSLRGLGLIGNENIGDIARAFLRTRGDSAVLPPGNELRHSILSIMLESQGATEEEAKFCSDIAIESGTAQALWTQRNVSAYAEMLMDQGKLSNLGNVYTPTGMSGGFGKIARAVQKGRVTGPGQEPVLDSMKAKRSKWAGDILTAPREGLLAVANSKPWTELLKNQGVTADRAMNISMNVALAKVFMRNDISFSCLGSVGDWIADTSVDLIPEGLTTADILSAGQPDTLAYFKGDSSHEKRKYNRDDSKYLVMAVRIPRKVFKTTTIKDLRSNFRLDHEDLKVLNNRYNIWAAPKA